LPELAIANSGFLCCTISKHFVLSILLKNRMIVGKRQKFIERTSEFGANFRIFADINIYTSIRQ
jgi:hypothetical protein